jgi:alkylation response protein AidB-like acyl-CoA dehydrogenase
MFEALGMRASGSGSVELSDVRVPDEHLVGLKAQPGIRPTQFTASIWFGICIASVYLGIGKGALDEVIRWAVQRRPGDGSFAVADLPLIRSRIGKIYAELRSAEILFFELAQR